MTTPKHCPGFESFRNLSSFSCKCPNCNEEIEIFSDEFDKEKFCPGCKSKIDFTQCKLSGSAG